MSPALNDACKQYYSAYCEAFDKYSNFAREGKALVAELLADGGLVPHAVTGRAKDPGSLLRKLRRRAYGNPATEITDIVGIRVITYFRDEVDRSVQLLKPQMTVNEAKSVDKRSQLDLREFGYRSVHLIGRLSDIGIRIPDEFAEIPFEVQVRSILEHAWAENEHELVYKSGITFSSDTSREFAAVAGTLELLDREFERFRLTVMSESSRRFQQLRDEPAAWALPCDAASVIGTMECLAPDNPGWRTAAGTLPAKSAALAVEALVAAGLTTPQAIRLAFVTPRFKAALAAFAALSGVTDDEVSHLAIGALLAATQPGFVREDFPDLLSDPLLMEALESGASE